jgi:hypothetical protein
VLVTENLLESDTKITFKDVRGPRSVRELEYMMHVPHHLPVRTPDVQFKITPSSCGIIALRIRTIKA